MNTYEGSDSADYNPINRRQGPWCCKVPETPAYAEAMQHTAPQPGVGYRGAYVSTVEIQELQPEDPFWDLDLLSDDWEREPEVPLCYDPKRFIAVGPYTPTIKAMEQFQEYMRWLQVCLNGSSRSGTA